MTEQPFIWCVVANVTREPHPEGPGGEMRLGTKRFAPAPSFTAARLNGPTGAKGSGTRGAIEGVAPSSSRSSYRRNGLPTGTFRKSINHRLCNS